MVSKLTISHHVSAILEISVIIDQYYAIYHVWGTTKSKNKFVLFSVLTDI